jgi:hypothetical protein
MPLEKLARKPTNEGMKIVKNICRLDLAGELIDETLVVWSTGESICSELFCSGADCRVFAFERGSSSMASNVLVIVVVAMLSEGSSRMLRCCDKFLAKSARYQTVRQPHN